MGTIIEWVIQGIYEVVSWVQDPNNKKRDDNRKRKRKEKQDD